MIVPSGLPIPGASISIEGKGGAQAATTDGNGEYHISGLAAGVYQVKISAQGYEPFEVQITATSNLVTEADAVLSAIPKPVEPAATPAETPAAQEKPGEAPAASTTQTTVSTQEFSVTPHKGKAAVFGVLTDQSGAVIASGVATLNAAAGPIRRRSIITGNTSSMI